MGTYRKKPVTVEARQFTTDANADELAHWCAGSHSAFNDRIYVTTAQDKTVPIDRGEWIILEDQERYPGCAYPCHPDVFKQLYDPADQVTDKARLNHVYQLATQGSTTNDPALFFVIINYLEGDGQ